MKDIIGFWIITTNSGETWFSERHDGDTIEDAQKDAEATFGAGCTVEIR